MHSKIIVARIPPVITTVPAVIRKALHQHPKKQKQRQKGIRLTRNVYIKLFMIKRNPPYDHCVWDLTPLASIKCAGGILWTFQRDKCFPAPMIRMPKSSPHRDECEWAEQMGGKERLNTP